MFNWAGNHEYGAEHVIELTSVSALAEELARTPKVRALGTRHSFNDIADGQVIVDTLVAREHLEINADRTEVTVNGSMTYGRLAELLEPLGFALHNLASLPHISIAGAISTGTHGSGVNNKSLAAAVTGIELATSSGEVGRLVRGDADFTGSVVGLGALGVMTKVSLEIEPAYEVAQFVYDDLPQEVFGANIDEIMGLGYSVSGFTTWGGSVEQLWVKHRLPLHVDMPATIFGATIASEDRHPIRGHAAGACTAQRGEAGLWSDRLPHFRIDFTPSAGDEIQSEFFVEWTRCPATHSPPCTAIGDHGWPVPCSSARFEASGRRRPLDEPAPRTRVARPALHVGPGSGGRRGGGRARRRRLGRVRRTGALGARCSRPTAREPRTVTTGSTTILHLDRSASIPDGAFRNPTGSIGSPRLIADLTPATSRSRRPRPTGPPRADPPSTGTPAP